ncbi:Cysteine-rich receptor-like protein kinase 28 [Hirschfeldia incana]|nr:Cysteine-rich receptor-like protein kinase 28 [Hirschfeldia incana]
MEHVRIIVFFACVLMFVPFHALAQADTYEFAPSFNCLGRGNFTANSTFAGNLNRLVSSLSSRTSEAYGFYNLSSGSVSGEVAYAIGLCRRDILKDDCLSCIQTAALNLTKQCPQEKLAVMWYTHCMFRYSNVTIYGRKETHPTLGFIVNQTISSNKDEFKRSRRELLNRLKGLAAAGGPNRKYAQGNSPASTGYSSKFYGSAQCSPDLSEQDCANCLDFGFELLQVCCDDKIGRKWYCPSCNFRFETWRFYELDADLEPDPPARKTERTGFKVVIAIVVPIVLVASFAIWLCLVLKWKKNKSGDTIDVLGNPPLSGSVADDEFWKTDSLMVDFEDLKVATNNFSSENELGRGGFGSVYKGVFSHGQEIAVKRLSGTSGQGDAEFKNEILVLAKLQHRNLVRLLGFCIHGQERLLVYELIKNASLDHFIFDPEKRQVLDWGIRYKMISGVARALLYLHEDSCFRTIHRDLKASNILLDQELNPKIADFGLAKLFDTGQTMTQRFTNRIAGTYGYMAPEYAMYGQFSVKTDVFSFGVLVIEIITGKRNNNGGSADAENLLACVSIHNQAGITWFSLFS